MTTGIVCSANSIFNLRSGLTSQAFFHLANGMDGPESHLASGLAPAAADVSAATHGLFHVHSCKGHQRPACAFVAIRHRDHWYYIDDRDHESKATMLLVMQLRRLDFQRQRIGVAPALTLPIGR